MNTNTNIKYQRAKLGWSILIALGLVGLGVLANWYVVYVWATQTLAINQTPNPYQELYEQLLGPSVKVTTPQGSGSGVVISHRKDAEDAEKTIYILTAAHVVGDYAEVTVEFYHTPLNPLLLEGTLQRLFPSIKRGQGCVLSKAAVVITDTAKDLALLQIRNPKSTIRNWPAVRLAPKGYVPYIFTPVWVIGASLGFPPRPTSGEITRVDTEERKNGETEEPVLPSLGSSVLQSYWEINAPIWPGNSGGGVFLKSNHQLIGIAVWVRVYRGQLVSTMAGMVPLPDIYEFLEGYERG